MRPLAILSAPGSRGDVNPMVAIGRELVQLGYDCHVSVAEPYAEIVEAAGLNANVVIDRETFHRVASEQQFWRPWSGARRLLSELADSFLLPHLRFIDQNYVPGRTVLVAHPLDFASRLFRETKPECVLSSVHLAPAMMRHAETPPRLLPDRGLSRYILPADWSRLNRLTYYLGDHCFLDRVIGPGINAERRRRGGLPRQRRLFHDWWRSPDQVLGLYPAWFAPEIAATHALPREGVAPLRCIGFPLDDGFVGDGFVGDGSIHARDPSGSDQNNLPDDRPLLVTTGSAHPGEQKLIKRIADIASTAGVSVVWCCPSNPGGLDHPNVRNVGYIALGKWLPRCRAIIHHGGIGTTSRAIDANVPQMIRPMAFDQFDNASRVERFGLGVWLRNDRDLATGIGQLLTMNRTTPPQPDAAFDDKTMSTAHRAATMIDRLRTS